MTCADIFIDIVVIEQSPHWPVVLILKVWLLKWCDRDDKGFPWHVRKFFIVRVVFPPLVEQCVRQPDNGLNRVTSIGYSTGIASGFEYDGGGFGTAADVGHLTKFTDESGQTALHYDGLGRLTSKTQTTLSTNGASATLTIAYAYGTEGSAVGKLASITYPSGNRINYLYDASGQVSSVTLNPANPGGGTSAGTTVLLSGISYSPFGSARSWTWGDGGMGQSNVYTRTFDLNGRVTSYPLGNPNAGGLVRTVAYDAASRITSMTHAGGGSPASFDQTFGYDDLDRLTSFTSSTSSLSYSYDANGNRTALRVGADNYVNSIASNSNRLTNVSGPIAKVDAFDSAGNTTSDGNVIFNYSYRGRLQRSTKAGVPTDYVYNAIGQRVSKSGTLIGKGANFFAYDEQGHTLGEYGAGGAAIEETVYLSDTPIAVLTNGSVYQVYVDHINTPRVIADGANSAIVWRWDMADPFGFAGPNQDPSGQGSTFVYNPRFPGQMFDQESGLHYNVYRDYDPQTGRYLQSDPIGLAGGVNTYAYVGGNPITAVDSLGLETEVTIWRGVGMASSAFGHVSTSVNGQNFSWGPGGWDTKYPSSAEYNERQKTFRGGDSYSLNLTPKEETAFKQCLSAHSGSYGAIGNNCANPVQQCLPLTMRLPRSRIFPGLLGDDLAKSPGLKEVIHRQGPSQAPPSIVLPPAVYF